MKILKITAVTIMGLAVSGCGNGQRTGSERWVDAGFDAKSLTQLVAGIWVDSNGCDHWIIDDGLEGYLSERLTPDGRSVCSGVAPPSTVVGPFMGATTVSNTL